MKVDWSFPRQVGAALFILGALAAYPLARLGDGALATGFAAGAILTTANVLLGYAAIEYSLDKSTATFFKFVLGGMGVRMFAMAGALVALITVFGVHMMSLIVSMGIFYVVFLTMEILFIQKRVRNKQQGS